MSETTKKDPWVGKRATYQGERVRITSGPEGDDTHVVIRDLTVGRPRIVPLADLRLED